MKEMHIWLYATEPDKVHYSVPNGDGTRRHLWQAVDTVWGKWLVAEHTRRCDLRDLAKATRQAAARRVKKVSCLMKENTGVLIACALAAVLIIVVYFLTPVSSHL